MDLLIKRGLINEKYDTNKQVIARKDIDTTLFSKADTQQSKEG